MKSRFRALTSAAALILACVAAKAPDEGMWPLDTLERLPLRTMRARGLHLTPEQISGTHGPGLKDAVVLLGGGTASFVSPDGLMLTNHHVAGASRRKDGRRHPRSACGGGGLPDA